MISMRTSAAGRKAIAQREGNKLTAYVDSVGVLTIGVGHTAAAGPPVVKKSMRITAAESDQILSHDLADVEAIINKVVKVPLNQSQFDALVSLVFNIGGSAFSKSTMLKRLNARDYSGAANQFLVWNKGTVNGKRVALSGLTARRKKEQAQFLSDGVRATPAAAMAVPATKTDTTSVEIVQRKLFEKGYTEVGSRRADGSFDGEMGKMTRAAITVFRQENDLPTGDFIDQDLLDALDTAPARKLARNDAPAQLVRQAVPEVRSNWLMKIGALITAGISSAGAFFDGIVANLGVAHGYVDNVKDYAADVPGYVWMGAVVAVAGGVYLVARYGEEKGVEAFQSGERR
ncbi:glycoside hydrolase family protein [Rhizobium hidalgonense]|uniref:glycoside hydrolase family protein n=1 Tax=Rhizobium hidalgonense TaxID=1538159 RepID=UPI0028726100|nr:glycoside hydrolase family protein [Rhizobium hidalgonense]MDR9809559.1 glycoside hydrolase family protein [Rhizobium hidalgonense]